MLICDIQIQHLIMGQSDSNLLSQQKQLAKAFTVHSTVKQQNLTFLTSRATQAQFLMREMIYNEEAEYNSMLGRVEERRRIKSQFITQLERMETVRQENLCSKFYRIFTLWEYPRRTLAEEISERGLVKLPFTEGELKKMLLQISEGMANYQANNLFHQSLTTKSILLTPQASVKVVDVFARPTRSNFDAIFNKRSLKNVYLSPEQCRLIESQEIGHFLLDMEKSDVFVAGMIMIECALLERQSDCYENEFERINWGKIDQRLKNVESRYGQHLRFIIERMLVLDVARRTDWKGLIVELNKQRAPVKINLVKVNRRPEETYKVSVPVVPVILPNQPKFRFSYNQPLAYKKSLKQLIQDAPVVAPIQSKPIVHLPPMAYKNRPAESSLPEVITFRNLNDNNAITSKHSQAFPPARQQRQDTTINLIDSTPAKFHTALRQLIEADSPQPVVNNFVLHARTNSTFSVDRYAEGKRYQGYKVNGKKEGFGKFFLQNKVCFQGNWKEDMMQGQGKLFYESGTLAYDGFFEKDRFHGFGRLYNESPQLLLTGFNYQNFDEIGDYWSVYEGLFDDDLKEGKGMLRFSNGEVFQGMFHRDVVEGQGVFTRKDGEKIRGYWVGNRLERIIS